MFTNIKKCWNCKNELDERTSQKCEICGWYICENCQRCASPDFGGCKEANKRITRNVEIDKEKEKINEKKEKLKQVFINMVLSINQLITTFQKSKRVRILPYSKISMKMKLIKYLY